MKKLHITLGLGLILASFVTFLPTTVSAHRDGCHRWHSCPSDTGSYVCGDLGYYSECPTVTPAPAPVHVPVITTKNVDTTEVVPYSWQYRDTWLEYAGFARTLSLGKDGVRTFTHKITYSDGQQTNSELINSRVTTEPMAGVQEIGRRIPPQGYILSIKENKKAFDVVVKYEPQKKVRISVNNKKLGIIQADDAGQAVFKSVSLRKGTFIKLYKNESGRDQQISEKTFVNTQKKSLETEYQRLHK